MADEAHGKALTAGEAAERLGISRRTAARWCAQGRLPGAYKVGEGKRATWYVPAEALADVEPPLDKET